MLYALSTGHKLGLGLVGGIFIAFAAVSALIVPRSRPGFPGRGLRLFVAASVLLFVAMLTAVVFFGREKSEAGTAETSAPASQSTQPATTSAGAPTATIGVTETEWKVKLATAALHEGSYVFRLKNAGTVPHNLTISGPQVENAATATIGPGKTAELRVALGKGTYDFYCSVPGHKQQGMDLKVKVS